MTAADTSNEITEIPGITLVRDERGALHLRRPITWPEDIVMNENDVARFTDRAPETSHAYITATGILIIRTAESTAGYRLGNGLICKRVI